ncbi:MAG: hypothetical protein ACAI44_18980 [Candidatus Sericytochromatia bacterium]
MTVNLNGAYGNVGKETLLALNKAAKSDAKIEAPEVDAIETAAKADGDFSDGEKALIAQLREGTRDKQEIKGFELTGFDPADPALEFGSFNLDIKSDKGTIKPVYVERLREETEKNSSSSDDVIRRLVSDPKRLELTAKLNPDRLVKAVDTLRSGHYSEEDRVAVVKIFNAVPLAQKIEILKKLNADGDDVTLRDLSENARAMQDVAKADPAVFDKAIETLKSGYYAEEDAAAVARLVAAMDPAKQQSFVKELIKRNDSTDDDTLAALSQKSDVLKNLDTDTKLQSLAVLYGGNVSAEDKAGMRRILQDIGFLTISDDTAKNFAQAIGGLSSAEKTKLAAQIDLLQPTQKTDLVKAFNLLTPDQLQASFKALLVPAGKDELGSMVKLLTASHNKPSEIAAFSEAFVKLSDPEKASGSKLIHLLMQDPPPATLRADLAAELDKLGKLGGSSEKVGLALNKLGLFLPATSPKAPGTEDATSRLKTVYMGQYLIGNPNADYIRDMLKVAKAENFKVSIQGSLSEFPTAMPSADIKAKEAALDARGDFSRANLDTTIKLLTDLGQITGATSAADKDKQAKSYLAKVALFKDKLSLDLQSKEKLSKTEADALVNDPNRLEIRLTPNDGYIWAEDNKWIKVDGTVTSTPPLRLVPGASSPDAAARIKARAFTNVELGQAPGSPGSEGHHTAGSPGNDPADQVSQSWRGSVARRERDVDAKQLGIAVNGKPADETKTYNEGGNMLTGTKPNGESYAVIGRDGLLLSVFHLEDKKDAVFDAAKVDARVKAMGLDKPFASLPKATQDEIDVTVKRLKASGEVFADRTAEVKRATEFLAKIDITKDLFAQDTGIDRKNLCFVAQPDFHIDMHMRPLGPGQIMINDFDANIKLLQEAKAKAKPGSWEDKELDTMIAHSTKMKALLGPVMDQIAQQLKDSGLEVIRAPGVMEGKMSPGGETRHVNFMNAIPGTSNGSNKQFYMTNSTSLPSLRAAYEDYLKKERGIETVYWIGGDGGGPATKSTAEQSLDDNGGLDCRENH